MIARRKLCELAVLNGRNMGTCAERPDASSAEFPGSCVGDADADPLPSVDDEPAAGDRPHFEPHRLKLGDCHVAAGLIDAAAEALTRLTGWAAVKRTAVDAGKSLAVVPVSLS